MAMDLWMVRSSGRILGPFPKNKIKELLLTQEISVHDEVSGPRQNFRPFDQKKEFIDLLASIRIELENLKPKVSEESLTLSVTGSIDEKTLDLSNSKIIDEKTVDLLSSKSEIIIESIKEEPTLKPTSPEKPERVYGYQASTESVESSKALSNRLWIGVGVLATLFVVAILVNQFVIAPKGNIKNFNDLVVLGKNKFFLGDYQGALADFKKANELKKDKDNYLFLAPLLIQVGDDPVSGIAITKELIEMSDDGKSLKRAYAILGITEMNYGDEAAAMEHFNQALQFDEDFEPAILNLALLQIAKKNYDEAIRVLNQRKIFSAEPILADYVKAIALIHQSEQDEKKWAEVNPLLEKITQPGGYLWQEAKLLNLYVKAKSQLTDLTDGDVESLLDIDPDLTKQHRWNLFINSLWLQWKNLKTYCDFVASKIQNETYKITLQALCELKINNNLKAQELANQAELKGGDSAIVLSQVAYIKEQLGQDVEASVLLGMSQKKNTDNLFLLPHILQARFCKQKLDFECELNEAQAVLQSNPQNLPAIGFMAHAYLGKEQHGAAQDWVQKGLKKTSDYTPVLEVEQKLKEVR